MSIFARHDLDRSDGSGIGLANPRRAPRIVAAALSYKGRHRAHGRLPW